MRNTVTGAFMILARIWLRMDANVEAMVRDLQEILKIGAEQKRLWEVYEGR